MKVSQYTLADFFDVHVIFIQFLIHSNVLSILTYLVIGLDVSWFTSLIGRSNIDAGS